MNRPRISIIVAVYSSQEYISRCIMSILNQTYTNTEIILVDNGSPDKSPQICDNFATLDSRIKVIHKEKEGAYAAWNTGLNHMTGEYVSFIDGDDFVSKDYIKRLLFICRKYHCDIASCSLVYGMDNDFCNVSQKGRVSVYDKTCAFMSRKIKAHIYGRLYKASLFERERARKVYYIEEDLIYRLFYQAERAAFTDQKLYYYYQSPNSLIRNDKSFDLPDYLGIQENRIRFFEDKERELCVLSWEYYCIALLLFYIRCRADRKILNIKEELLANYRNAYKAVMSNNITPLYYKLILSIFSIAPDLCTRLYHNLHFNKLR